MAKTDKPVQETDMAKTDFLPADPRFKTVAESKGTETWPKDKVRLQFRGATKEKPHSVGDETMDPYGFFSFEWAKRAVVANPDFMLADPRFKTVKDL